MCNWVLPCIEFEWILSTYSFTINSKNLLNHAFEKRQLSVKTLFLGNVMSCRSIVYCCSKTSLLWKKSLMKIGRGDDCGDQELHERSRPHEVFKFQYQAFRSLILSWIRPHTENSIENILLVSLSPSTSPKDFLYVKIFGCKRTTSEVRVV